MLRTQPAISIAIKRLEEELGETLFDRSSKSGTLTEAGQTLYSYAQRMINLRDEAVRAIGELKGMYRGRLSIGANESTSLYLLPPLLLKYREQHPHIRIEVYRNVSERIPSEVLERNLISVFSPTTRCTRIWNRSRFTRTNWCWSCRRNIRWRNQSR